jgi:isoleucyl-tRNA synthetase
MSKSAGNVVAPQEVIQKYGAEILRLWVASTDFREDVRISPEILSQLVETYRKIRNTCRFLLGNLYDFDPKRDGVGDASFLEIDRWALGRLQHLIQRVRRGYADYEFHIVVHALNNFCAVEMSAVYLDVLKDRLYVSRSNSLERRAAQRVLYEVLVAMTQLMAPILSFTAEEIWDSLIKGREGQSVYLTGFPEARSDFHDVTLANRWERLLLIREEVSRVLETARQKKEIGHSLEAAVTLYAGGELLEFLRGSERDLPMLLIVSVVMILPIAGDDPHTLPVDRPANVRPETCLPDRRGGMPSQAVAGEVLKELGILVERASGDKCERCWMYLESVGRDKIHPTLCARCVGVLSGRADA